MLDPMWQAAFDAISAVATEADSVLAPLGDWPGFRGAARFYRDMIEPGGASLLLLHKGRLSGMPEADLTDVALHWQCIFANEVFLGFSRRRRIRLDARLGRGLLHFLPLFIHLHARRFRKRRGQLFYIHIPKTGGTSFWTALARSFPAHIYYPSPESFLRHPPEPGRYDLIGGHLPLDLVATHVQQGDRVLGLLRDPTERVLSAFLHSRRPREDPATFGPAMQAMRSMTFRDFLQTPHAAIEARQQLLQLGVPHGAPFSVADEPAIYARAASRIAQPGSLFFPTNRVQTAMDVSARLLGFKPRPLDRLNAADRTEQAADIAEFNASIAEVEAQTRTERALYQLVQSGSLSPVGVDRDHQKRMEDSPVRR